MKLARESNKTYNWGLFPRLGIISTQEIWVSRLFIDPKENSTFNPQLRRNVLFSKDRKMSPPNTDK